MKTSKTLHTRINARQKRLLRLRERIPSTTRLRHGPTCCQAHDLGYNTWCLQYIDGETEGGVPREVAV